MIRAKCRCSVHHPSRTSVSGPVWTKLWQRGRAMPTTLRCSLRRRCTMHDAMAAVMEAGSTLSQWRVLVPMQEFDVPASIAVDALSAGRAARRAGRPRAFRKQGAAEGINCQGCNTTATTICDMQRARGSQIATRGAVRAGRDGYTPPQGARGHGRWNFGVATRGAGQQTGWNWGSCCAFEFPKGEP